MAAGAILMFGCGPSLGPSKPVSELTADEAQGRVVYAQYCASCHYANQTGDLHGPSLFAMYRKKYLPSGAPANDERVMPVILRGRNMMPGSQLSDEQLRDLMAYLHTL
jgi:mono/diheme cytochrome c family protein